ncbi:hypothetical protein K4A83_01835 [Spirulina subsalsa FACHB-351]|uniref:Uncharacterized protein n=1 Tax=Spirulina subsalsa FACHB-351 TaxID=234711 RepID=A0ABT3L0J2_9CYAN|nr:hypothetical protein [Spirulina subsalsa]MCW6035016.1 hypothetical protein [Spirulina subsalsa FACHB-351]
MNYPIPKSSEEIQALQHRPVNEELVAAAIAGVIQIARAQGKSLSDLTAEVLTDHNLLDGAQRRWLSELVTHAWYSLPMGE